MHESTESLTHAKKHAEPLYRAQALYQSSKTHYRLWLFEERTEELTKALEDAKTAASLYPDERYESWVEFVTSLQEDIAYTARAA